MVPFSGDVLCSHLLPRSVLEVVQQTHTPYQSGLTAEGYCWVLCAATLYIWKYKEGMDARTKTLTLPLQPGGLSSGLSSANTSGTTFFVSILPQRRTGTMTVLVCSDQGCLSVWLDVNYLAEPVTQQVVTAASTAGSATLASRSPPPAVAYFSAIEHEQGSGPSFIAALAGVDGSWYLIRGGSNGIITKQLATPAAKVESRGVFNTLGSVISYAYTEAFDPVAKYIKKQPSGRQAIAIHLAAAGSTSHMRVLLLTELTLDCWSVGGLTTHSPPPQFINHCWRNPWMFPFLPQKQEPHPIRGLVPHPRKP